MIYKTELSIAEKIGGIIERVVLTLREWRKYRDVAVRYAMPHIKKAGDYASDTAGKLNKIYDKKKRKAKRSIRMAKLRNITDIIKNIALIGVAVVAIFSLIIKLFVYLDD